MGGIVRRPLATGNPVHGRRPANQTTMFTKLPRGMILPGCDAGTEANGAGGCGGAVVTCVAGGFDAFTF
jgi:hypothetical protein